LKNKAILITGGAGYIGSHLAHQLLKKNSKTILVIIDNLSTGSLKNLPKSKNIIFIKSCISNFKSVKKIFQKFDIKDIYHLASSIKASESNKKSYFYCKNNISHSMSFLNYVKDFKFENLVFSSSAAVYGNTTNNYKILEINKCMPINIYGSNKKIMENFIMDHSRIFNYRYCFLRYFNIVGSNFNIKRYNFNQSLFDLNSKAIINQSRYNIYGSSFLTKDGTAVRDYIHISDIVDIHIKAMRYIKNNKVSDIFNCGYGNGFTVLEICNQFNKVFKKDLKINFLNPREGDPGCVIANANKLKKKLDWKPKFDNLNSMIMSHFNLYDK